MSNLECKHASPGSASDVNMSPTVAKSVNSMTSLRKNAECQKC